MLSFFTLFILPFMICCGLYRGQKNLSFFNSSLYISRSFHLILVCFPSLPGGVFSSPSPSLYIFLYASQFFSTVKTSRVSMYNLHSFYGVKSSQINHHWLPGSYPHNKNSAPVHKVPSKPYSELSSKNTMVSQRESQSNTKGHSKRQTSDT